VTVLGPTRKTLFQAADVLPWLLGGTFVWLGLRGRPGLLLAGTVVVVLAGVFQLATASGFRGRRAGRLRIVAQGCWETPQAFFVQHRGQALLFYRTFDAAAGDFPESYCVIALPSECDDECIRWRGFEPPGDSRLLGTVASRDLRFERHGGDYVDRRSLATALARICA
jgi:hypothetical protein